MNPFEIIFAINETHKIIANLKDPLNLVCWDYSEPIFFQNNSDNIMIADNPIYFNIRDLRDWLKKALNNDLRLHESITSDIGYLANIYTQNNKLLSNSFIIERFDNGFEEWVGYRYHLWFIHEDQYAYKTWIYNNHNGDIIFEITPFYPYRYCHNRSKHYIPFKKWLLNYKPYFVATLSRKTAQQWLEQAEHFVNTVDENIRRWNEEYKNSKK